ncbi:Uncharacterised protein [Yersinia enterocolitica]|uniref:hypothetical protein n=1 Tax=Yersinia TaxID=629 RepID=UPI0005DD5036|nr:MULTISPECIES: hypothetical protein [Yersinia]EKN3577046.1 hypothetical protein [Yersinia enterocolitica]EKN3637191.1 hypothetical protein [Yersinia enterocolitica]EKN3973867.1 hypothetical protein [Yersinia enterocolitica]EKN4025073.1 hypothetical protein [Yersinia enterocolitica]EKN4088601.1 hypothetical protein [Yersinia enterocolitica]
MEIKLKSKTFQTLNIEAQKHNMSVLKLIVKMADKLAENLDKISEEENKKQ